jgi:hypothetical protein
MSAPVARGAEETLLQRFAHLRQSFAERLDAVRSLDEPSFVRSDWADRNTGLLEQVLPVPPSDFLRCPEILHQMFVGAKYLPHELPYVLSRLADPAFAREDPVGDPPTSRIPGHQVTTSSNAVHHLHHLLRFEDISGRPVTTVDSVVEWGGGYGGLAKLFVRLHGGSPTYVLIDTPVFTAVQWLYLASVLGEAQVVLHAGPEVTVATGKINIVPIGLACRLDLDVDLFISTWALNESSVDAQRFVLDRNWFSAPSLLLGMHAGDPFAPHALDAGAVAVPLGNFMEGQQYLIR